MNEVITYIKAKKRCREPSIWTKGSQLQGLRLTCGKEEHFPQLMNK